MKTLSLDAGGYDWIASHERDPEAALLASVEDELDQRRRERAHAALRRRWLMRSLADLMLAFLPAEESWLLSSFMRGLSQQDAAEMMGVTQQAISKRLRGAVSRLAWASTLETWQHTAERLRADLSSWETTRRRIRRGLGALDARTVGVVVAFWMHRFSRARTARALGLRWEYGCSPVLDGILTSLRLPGAYGRDLQRVLDCRLHDRLDAGDPTPRSFFLPTDEGGSGMPSRFLQNGIGCVQPNGEMPSKRFKGLTIRLTEDEHARVVAAADERGESVAVFIRDLLRQIPTAATTTAPPPTGTRRKA